ncbi:helix-turn-helix domain-containing protein [Actinoplanes sp. CA-015351]|uniref:helix-turn-helix domain-containing protein n=1 Tax=Actinoplanes sp. CA-015351 TaxID=3239897 RepID=UPI003D98DEA4
MAKDELAAVGPRLRDLRQQRDLTLHQVADTTGISVSTLSRLESGSRKPTLELLLPLAKAYQVSLDDLVDAPETGDPRVRARPIVRGGRTYIPLSRRPGGLQAFKTIIGTGEGDCHEQKTHEGYEWLYVLSGTVRLRLGEHDLLLEPGEAAEFDTRLPHLVLNGGTEPAEVISIFGPQGERVHIRARSTSNGVS